MTDKATQIMKDITLPTEKAIQALSDLGITVDEALILQVRLAREEAKDEKNNRS